MMFHKDFQFPLEITRPEYKVLEELLDEGEPIANPYEIAYCIKCKKSHK